MPANKETLRNNAIVFYQALYSSGSAGINQYVARNYTEHQVSAGFTLEGLKVYAHNRTQIPGEKVIIHRTLVQGNLVCLHVEEQVAGDSSVARIALLQFNEAGKIVSHWEAVQGQPRIRANPHTMFDGARINYQSTAGIRGLEAAVAADQKAFNDYDTAIIRETRTSNYIQHNPTAGDGPDALIQLLTFLKTNGFHTILTNYQKITEGDFVLEMSNYQTTPGFPFFTNTIAFDLTRLTDDGKDAEHWDVLEELNGADKSKVF